MKKQYQSAIAIMVMAMLAASTGCKKETTNSPGSTNTPPPPTGYTVPTTYNGFTNADFTESTIIIGMNTELSAEIAKGANKAPATTPVPLSISHLLNLLQNQNNPFVNDPSYDASYNNSGYQIESNCIAASQAQLESYLDTLVAVSNSGTSAASDGIPGVGLTKDANPKSYLLTANGINYSQILNKGLMCDLVLYQICNRVANTTLDNTTLITNGTKQYTALEHNWDVAFGYWSVPDSFPLVKTPLKLWGSYSNQVDSGLHCNRIVMNAFLKGRAAIHNKDMATLQAQANIIVSEFDVMTAGGVCQELNEIKASIAGGDLVKAVSNLSECKGFVMSMYNNKNPKRIITDSQIATLLSYFPADHWQVTTNDLNNIANYIASIYGFTPSQMAVL